MRAILSWSLAMGLAALLGLAILFVPAYLSGPSSTVFVHQCISSSSALGPDAHTERLAVVAGRPFEVKPFAANATRIDVTIRGENVTVWPTDANGAQEGPASGSIGYGDCSPRPRWFVSNATGNVTIRQWARVG